MLHRVATLGLGPMLLAQGYYVRRTIPRLAEPSGARSGTAGAGPPLRLLIVGDSAAAGVGVETQAQALSGQLVAALAGEFRVSWALVAKSGYTSEQLIHRLRRTRPYRFDVAVTSLGVNDATAGVRPVHWLQRQGELIGLLAERFGVRHVLLSALPPVHRFPALPQPLRWYIGQRAHRLNRGLAAFAGAKAQCEIVSIPGELDPAAMAVDGFHPGPPVYALWAEQLAQVIRRRLGPDAGKQAAAASA